VAERIDIDDPRDPQIAIFLGLRDHATRQRLEQPGGPLASTFIAEGDVVIQRGLAAGLELRSVLVSARRTKPLPELPTSTTLFAASDDVLTEITGRPELRDPLACFTRPAPTQLDALLGEMSRVGVLVGVNNPNNLGVIMRNAAGLGIEAVLLDPTCGDPLYRRAVRASMGQVFAVPHSRIDPMPGALDQLHEIGFETIALTPSGDRELRDLATPERAAVVLGAEGPGLPSETIEAATHKVRIDMANDVDSLNVANAAAIAVHHLRP